MSQYSSLPGAAMASPLRPPVLPIPVPTSPGAHWSQYQLHPWAYLQWCLPLSCGAHPSAWQHPGVHLDPSRFHYLSAHHHLSNHPSQSTTILLLAHPSAATKFSDPVPTAGAELVAWQAVVVAMALHRHHAPCPCAQPGKGTPCWQPQITVNY